MLIWSILLTGIIALLFFGMYPRTDYIRTVETPIAQTPIVQFTTQHENALALALKSVEAAAERQDTSYNGYGTNANNLNIYYPNLTDKTYLPKNLKQNDWGTIQSRIVCINYDTDASVSTSCSLGGYANMDQTTPQSGTRDYLVTYAQKPAYFDTDYPGWGSAWADETKHIDTCGIVKTVNNKKQIQSVKCPNGLCDLSASSNTTRLQNLLNDIELTDNDFICISPIDHYAYDGVSITGKNHELLANYDGINNTWTGHNNSTTTWSDISGNGNNATIMGGTVNLTNIYLNGTYAQKIQLPNFLKNNKDFTADIVFNPTRINPSWNMLFSGSGDNNDFQIFFENSTKKMRLSIENKELESTFQLTDDIINLPYSLVSLFRYQNSKYTGNIYVNTENKLNKNFSINRYELNTSPLYLGGLNSKIDTYPIQGKFYAARFYAIPLTKKQIALNYQLDRKRFNMPKVVDDNGNDYTYLQNDGKAYIKTGVIPTGGTKAYIKAKVTQLPSSTSHDYGGTAYGANHNSYFIPLSTTGGGKFVYGFGWYHIVSAHTVSVGNIIESTLTVNAAGTSANVEYNNLTKGTSYTTTQAAKNGGTLNTPYDIYLFAGHNASTQTFTENAPAKIAQYTIWQDDELIRDFIPAEDPFGRPAMYDKVGGKFYYNANNSDGFTLVNN